MLTSAQVTTLTNSITANTATAPGTVGQIKDLAHTPDNAFAIAAWYNLTASPNFFGYHKAVQISDIKGAIQWKKLTPADAIPTTPQLAVTLWSARAQMCDILRAQVLALMSMGSAGAIDATPNRIVQGFNDALSAVPSDVNGANQDAGWAIVNGVQSTLCRKATNAEKLFADLTNGTGADNSHAASFGPFEGPINDFDIKGIWGI